jgi:hypothetical protein
MYKLPKDFTGAFLIGRTLESIHFSTNNVILHFSDDVVITIESTFLHYDTRSEAMSQVASIPVIQSSLMRLLGQPISEASGDEQGTLTLTFKNGHVLEIYDSATHYESYSIKHGDRLIIV